MDRDTFLAFIDDLPEEQRNELYAHPEEIDALVERLIDAKKWDGLFGHLKLWDARFNVANFPLVDDGDEAEEFNFEGRLVVGRQALEEFNRLNRVGASLGAQGRYINAHPEAQNGHSLLGIGTQWQSRDDEIWFPIYARRDDECGVSLRELNSDREYSPRSHWLLRKTTVA